MSDALFAGLPLVVFLVIGFNSVRVDIREHRLPNVLTLLCCVLIITVQLVVSRLTSDWTQWRPMLVCLLCLMGAHLFLFVISNSGLGFGDVKFAIPCGLIIGWYAPSQWLTAMWISFVSAALFALALWLLRGVRANTAIPFGPFMYFGVIMVTCRAIVSG